MATSRSTYLKIGLLVLLGINGLIAIGVLVGLHRLHRKVTPFYTYFDEAVTGLDVGSPVRARGVPIGQVGYITFAPDLHMVEVRGDVDEEVLEGLGFPGPPPPGGASRVPSNVRAQLASSGLTGGRFIALDFFDEKTNPPPELPFQPKQPYIPAARSVQKSLEQTVSSAMLSLGNVLATFEAHDVPERVAHTTDEADEVFTLVHKILQDADQQQLPQRASSAVDEFRNVGTRINKLVDHVDGDGGLLSTTKKSVGAVGQAGLQATDTTRNLNETLDEIRAAAGAVKHLADRLEREPDMLLKGRSKEPAP